MKWMRYTHKWAWGTSKEEEWVLFDETQYKADDEKSVHEFIRDMELCKEGDWSDKYRGINYDILDKPDDAWLRKKIKETKDRITGLNDFKQMLERLLTSQS